MFHSWEVNIKINNLHHRALDIVYRDETSTFEEPLLKNESITIYNKNLHILAIELYKVINGLGPTFMVDMFSSHPNLDSRTQSLFSNNSRTTKYGNVIR